MLDLDKFQEQYKQIELYGAQSCDTDEFYNYLECYVSDEEDAIF